MVARQYNLTHYPVNIPMTIDKLAIGQSTPTIRTNLSIS